MHITDWIPPKSPEGGDTSISDDISLRSREQRPSLRGRSDGAAMLSARPQNAPDRTFNAEWETSMDGINSIETVGFSILQLRDTSRSTACARAAVMMAIIVAMTLLTILALDYASIHLPVGTDELGWPPFG